MNNFQTATITAVQNLTPSVREFTLLMPHPKPWMPGSHVQVQLQSHGQSLLRHYSLTSLSTEAHYKIAVRRQDAGQGGSLAMWRLQVGDSLQVSAPRNHFSLQYNTPHTLLVAGGIGVTPLLSMVRALQGRSVRMLYAARSEKEMAYVDELRQALGSQLLTAADDLGQRLSLLSECQQAPVGSHVYVCGPLGMMQTLRSAWLQAGHAEANYHMETFGSSAAVGDGSGSYVVKLPYLGKEIEVPAMANLLQTLTDAGVALLSDCRRGECGLCALDVLALDGDIEHGDVFLSDTERQAQHKICVCVSRLRGRSITLDTGYRPVSVG